MANRFEKYEVKDFDESQKGLGNLLNRFDRNVLIGLANAGQSVVNLPHNVTGIFSEEYAEKVPRMGVNFAELLGQTKKEPTDVLTQDIAEIIPSFFLPAAGMGKVGKAIEQSGKYGKYAKAALGEAIPQSLYAGTLGLEQSPESGAESAAIVGGITAPLAALSEAVKSGSPLVKLAGRGALAAAGGLAGNELFGKSEIPYSGEAGGILGAVLGGKGINVNKNATKTVFEGLNPAKAREIVEASRRLGLDFVTPGEAYTNPFVAGEHARIGKTREGAEALYDAGRRRVESEERAIMKLFNDIYSKGKLDPEKQALYDRSLSTYVPDDVVEELMSFDTIQKAVKQLGSKAEYKDLLNKKSYDKNSIGYWNEVKRVLDGMKGKSERAGDNTAAGSIRDANNELKALMDALDPEYPVARSISEREFVRRDLSKVFNKSGMTLNRFDEFLRNKEQFNEVRSKLNAFPEVQQTLDDMRLVAPRLQNFDPTNKATAALERTGMFTARNPLDSIRDFLQRNVYQKQDVEAVKLMTDPRWLETLEQLIVTKGAPKPGASASNPLIDESMAFYQGNPVLGSLLKMTGKFGAQGIGEAQRESKE